MGFNFRRFKAKEGCRFLKLWNSDSATKSKIISLETNTLQAML